jgi:hypothetical protein
MVKTVQQLVTAAEKAIYQSAGAQVQVYSEDILAEQVRDAFTFFFTKAFWPQFRKREQRTLDGTTGQITAVLTYITQYDDIQHVFAGTSHQPLPVLPDEYNTLNMVGSSPRYVDGSADAKLFTIYPLTAIGDVLVSGRARPDISAMDSVVPCDEGFIVHYVAWSYFIDDGANPAAAAKHQMLFEQRLITLEQDAFSKPIALDSHAGRIPSEWFTS